MDPWLRLANYLESATVSLTLMRKNHVNVALCADKDSTLIHLNALFIALTLFRGLW